MSRARHRWSYDEDQTLLKLYPKFIRNIITVEQIETKLHRSVGACKMRFQRISGNTNSNTDNEEDQDTDESTNSEHKNTNNEEDQNSINDEDIKKHILNNDEYKPYTNVMIKGGRYLFCCKCNVKGGKYTMQCKTCKKTFFHSICILGNELECPKCKYIENYRDNAKEKRRWNEIDSLRLKVILSQGINSARSIAKYFPYLNGNVFRIIHNHITDIKNNNEIKENSINKKRNKHIYNTRSKGNKINK
eukprot:110268_1